MGMFSLVDAMLDRPLDSVLADLPVSADVRDALLSSSGPLRGVLGCALDYERGDWDSFTARAADAGIEEAVCPALYLESRIWGRRCFEEGS
jgi:EAL and modified HD-GYP domain-containing signal transduction protein